MFSRIDDVSFESWGFIVNGKLIGSGLASMLAVTGVTALTWTSPAVADLDAIIVAESSAVAVAETFVAPDTLVGASFVFRAGPTAAGTGTAFPDSSWPTAGFDFGVLSSGDVTDATSPNVSGSTTTSFGGPNRRGNSDFDVTILRVDVLVPESVNCLVGLDFQFFSEEYPEYVGSSFNDAFIAELDTSTWSTSGSQITAPDNFAFDEAGDPITINTVGATTMNPENAAGSTYDGATPLLRASTPITPGEHSIYLSIFDQGDRALDSTVLFDNLQFGQVEDVARDCRPGATTVDQFVYVAVGDSYSSGEGAPPFEDGANYPLNDPQENTLTAFFGGDSCHRSLVNYAKLNNGRFEPSQPALLVDRTCSGARIDPPAGESKAPIAGANARETQVEQALDRLGVNFGLTGDDVDLVTLSAGGNDAKFGDIVAACLVPNLARELFRAYDNTPGLVEFVVKKLGSCKRIDDLFFNSSDAIDELVDLELRALADLFATFPEALVLQLTYPSIVPEQDNFGGDTCGGIRKDDANYARERVSRINDKIREAIAIADDARPGMIRVVDLEDAFGENPLCPANPSAALAHGVDQARLRTTVEELIANPEVRELLDKLVDEYNDLQNCIAAAPAGGPIGGAIILAFCSTQVDDIGRAAEAVGAYFTAEGRLDALVGSLVEGDSVEERFENSRNLFHPNPDGFQIMACQTLETYQFGQVSGFCAPNSMGLFTYEWDGVALGLVSPIKVVPGASIPVRFNGFNPGSEVGVTYYSDPIEGVPLTADATGEIAGTITIPDQLLPGVHRVEFAGANGGRPRVVEVLIEIDGRPVGGAPYATYLDGFEPGEDVTVTYGGLELYTTEANQDGGVLVDVVMVDPAGPSTIRIEATGATSGVSAVEVLAPIPSSSALWATSSEPDAIDVGGSPTISGPVHSEGGIEADGNASFENGAEHVGAVQVRGNAHIDPAAQVAAGASAPAVAELERTIADLAPTVEIPASECSGGRWRPTGGDLLDGIVHVPCDVELKSSRLDGPVGATIIADGSFALNGSGIVFAQSELPSLVSRGAGAGIDVSGSGHVLGALYAHGPISVSGGKHTFVGEVITTAGVEFTGGQSVARCGIYAATIRLSGGNSTFTACPGPPG